MHLSDYRRRTVVAVLSVLFIGACQTGPNPMEPLKPTDISGTFNLPDGAVLDTAGLQIDTPLGNSPLAADGSFAGQTPGGTSAFVILRDAAGKAILFGTAAGGAPAELSAKSTANVLLFFALGGFAMPADLKAQILEAINQHAAADDLAAVIAERIIANPTAIGDADQQILDALTAAVAKVAAAPPSGRARLPDPGARGRSTKPYNHDDVSPLTLLEIEPAGGTLQSGVEVLQNPNGAGLIATNHFRRRCHVFAYKTGTEDDNGNKTLVSPPQTAADTPLDTTQGLSSVTLSFTGIPVLLYDMATGTSPWSPVSSKPFELPADDGEKKTFYDVIVIGPAEPANAMNGPFNLASYANAVPVWQATQRSAAIKTCFLDVIIPILGMMWDCRVIGQQQATIDAAVGELEALMTRSLPEFLELTKDVKYAKAVELLLNEVGRNPAFVLELFDISAKFVAEASLLVAQRQAAVQQLQHRMQNNVIIFAVNLALTGGDLGAVIKDHAESAGAETWQVTAVRPTARLGPEKADVVTGETVIFRASMNGTEGLNLRYRWQTSGNFGSLSDGAGGSGKDFESDHSAIVYTANSNVPDGSKDTITVDVLQVTGENQTGKLGSASAEATVRVNLNCDELDVAPYKSGCGSISLSSAEVTAGDTLTVTVFAGCGGGRLSCDYADPDTVKVDGVTTPGNAGYPGLYSYDPPRPSARFNGAAVQLTNGPHTVEFRIPLDAPNDCLNIVGTTAVGPWVFLGGSSPGRWSTVAHFRVRQKGI